MLTPDRVRYENGVKICEKIIPDNAKATKYVASWVPKGGYMKPRVFMTPIGVTLHNTDDLKNVHDDAEQYTRATYPNCNMGGVCVHYYVDDVCAWQNLRENEAGWHASDGAGNGNRKTIAIECIMTGSGSSEDLKARDNAARLIAAIFKRYNWNVEDNLFTHNHWLKKPDKIVHDGKKNCPVYILPKYDEFKALVNKYLGAEENKPVISESTSIISLKYSDINVGDILEFKGTKQYPSAGVKAIAKPTKPATVKVTSKSKENYAHPIHVRSIKDNVFTSDVYGWVNLSDLSKSEKKSSYRVRVISSALNYRKGPGVDYPVVGVIRDRGVYTITDVVSGWGKLASGAGWINLSYANKID